MSKEKQYLKDPILFMEEHYVLPETMKLIKLQPFQKDWILKPLYYNLKPNGKRKYKKALLGMPKKNGKSAFAAGLGIYHLFCGENFGEVIVAANAKDQASMIIYNKMRRSVMMDKELHRACSPMHKEKIEVYSTGTTARCIAAQFETAAGLNPTLTMFDELWGTKDRKFYDELTVVPTRQDPLIVIVTYAGYEEEGLLWDLYNDGMEGETIIDTGDPEIVVKQGRKDKDLFMFWSNKNLQPWVTKEYIDGQRASLPPDVFARLHENRWVSSGSQFITEDDIDGLHNTPWVIQIAPITDRYVRYFVATDLGLSHDRTARVVGHYEPRDNNVYIDNIRVWQGTVEAHVPIEEVEKDLVDCAITYRASTLIMDPWQMEYVIQRLKKYYQVKPFSFQGDITHLSQVLINLIRSKRLKCYQEPMLDDELRTTIIRQGSNGWRIDHAVKRTNDLVIATGMMCMEAISGATNFILPGDDEFTTAPEFQGIRNREF